MNEYTMKEFRTTVVLSVVQFQLDMTKVCY